MPCIWNVEFIYIALFRFLTWYFQNGFQPSKPYTMEHICFLFRLLLWFAILIQYSKKDLVLEIVYTALAKMINCRHFPQENYGEITEANNSDPYLLETVDNDLPLQKGEKYRLHSSLILWYYVSSLSNISLSQSSRTNFGWSRDLDGDLANLCIFSLS